MHFDSSAFPVVSSSTFPHISCAALLYVDSVKLVGQHTRCTFSCFNRCLLIGPISTHVMTEEWILKFRPNVLKTAKSFLHNKETFVKIYSSDHSPPTVNLLFPPSTYILMNLHMVLLPLSGVVGGKWLWIKWGCDDSADKEGAICGILKNYFVDNSSILFFPHADVLQAFISSSSRPTGRQIFTGWVEAEAPSGNIFREFSIPLHFNSSGVLPTSSLTSNINFESNLAATVFFDVGNYAYPLARATVCTWEFSADGTNFISLSTLDSPLSSSCTYLRMSVPPQYLFYQRLFLRFTLSYPTSTVLSDPLIFQFDRNVPSAFIQGPKTISVCSTATFVLSHIAITFANIYSWICSHGTTSFCDLSSIPHTNQSFLEFSGSLLGPGVYNFTAFPLSIGHNLSNFSTSLQILDSAQNLELETVILPQNFSRNISIVVRDHSHCLKPRFYHVFSCGEMFETVNACFANLIHVLNISVSVEKNRATISALDVKGEEYEEGKSFNFFFLVTDSESESTAMADLLKMSAESRQTIFESKLQFFSFYTFFSSPTKNRCPFGGQVSLQSISSLTPEYGIAVSGFIDEFPQNLDLHIFEIRPLSIFLNVSHFNFSAPPPITAEDLLSGKISNNIEVKLLAAFTSYTTVFLSPGPQWIAATATDSLRCSGMAFKLIVPETTALNPATILAEFPRLEYSHHFEGLISLSRYILHPLFPQSEVLSLWQTSSSIINASIFEIPEPLLGSMAPILHDLAQRGAEAQIADWSEDILEGLRLFFLRGEKRKLILENDDFIQVWRSGFYFQISQKSYGSSQFPLGLYFDFQVCHYLSEFLGHGEIGSRELSFFSGKNWSKIAYYGKFLEPPNGPLSTPYVQIFPENSAKNISTNFSTIKIASVLYKEINIAANVSDTSEVGANISVVGVTLKKRDEALNLESFSSAPVALVKCPFSFPVSSAFEFRVICQRFNSSHWTNASIFATRTTIYRDFDEPLLRCNLHKIGTFELVSVILDPIYEKSSSIETFYLAERTNNSLTILWEKPYFQGCSFLRYKFEIASPLFQTSSSDTSNSTTQQWVPLSTCDIRSSCVTQCVLSSLQPGQQYSIRGQVECTNSDANSAWTTAPPTFSTLPLSASTPSNVTIKNVTESSFIVQWHWDGENGNCSAPGPEIQILYRIPDVQSEWQLPLFKNSSCLFAQKGTYECEIVQLLCNKIYQVGVRVGGCTDSLAFSEFALSLPTKTLSQGSIPCPLPADQPTNVVIFDIGQKSFRLNFTAGERSNDCKFSSWNVTTIGQNTSSSGSCAPRLLSVSRSGTTNILCSQNLTSMSSYYVIVSELCVGDEGNSNSSAPSAIFVTKGLPANVPTNVVAKTTGRTSQSLTWTVPTLRTCILSYWKVEVQEMGAALWSVVTSCHSLTAICANACNSLNLKSSTLYSYRVTAICTDSSTNSLPSSPSVAVRTDAFAASSPTRPFITEITDTSVVLNWEVPKLFDCIPAKWAIRQRIKSGSYGPVSGGNCSSIPTSMEGRVACQPQGLFCGTAYEFRVALICSFSAASSDFSPSVNVTTTTSSLCTFPAEPPSVNSSITNSVVKVQWVRGQAGSCTFSRWEVVAYGSGTTAGIIPDGCGPENTNVENVTQCFPKNLLSKTSYSFSVRQICTISSLNSQLSALTPSITTSLKPASPPERLEITNVSKFSFTANWEMPTLNDCDFKMWYINVSNHSTSYQATPPGYDDVCSRQAFIQYLNSSTDYWFTISVNCSDSEAHSKASSESPAKTTLGLPANPPGAIGISVRDHESVSVSWSSSDLNSCNFAEWLVEYRLASSSLWVSDACPSSSNIFDFSASSCVSTGLFCKSDYHFRVKVVCRNSEADSSFTTTGSPVQTADHIVNGASVCVVRTQAPTDVTVQRPSSVTVRDRLLISWTYNVTTGDCNLVGFDVEGCESFNDECLEISAIFEACIVNMNATRSCTASGLTSNTYYLFFIRARCKNEGANSLFASSLPVATHIHPSDSVQGVTVDEAQSTPNSLAVSFSPGFFRDCSFQYFLVEASTLNAPTKWFSPIGCSGLTEPCSTNCIATSLTSNTAHRFRVSIRCATSAAEPTVLFPSTYSYTLPTPANHPIGPLLSNPTSSSLDVVWTAGSTTEVECEFSHWQVVLLTSAGSEIYGPSGCRQIFNRTLTSCTITNVHCDSSYSFKVREICVDSAANSPFSDASSTLSTLASEGNCVDPAVPPTNLVAKAATDPSSLGLSWTASPLNDCFFFKYSVYLLQEGFDVDNVVETCTDKLFLLPAETSCTATNLLSNTRYRFYVDVICSTIDTNSESSLWSSYSRTAVIAASIPTGVHGIGLSDPNSLSVMWGAPDLGDCSFLRWEVKGLWKANNSEFDPVGCVQLTDVCDTQCIATNTPRVSGNLGNETFQFKVRVLCNNPMSNSPFSEWSPDILTKSIPATLPKSLNVTSSAKDILRLNWAPGDPKGCTFASWEVQVQPSVGGTWTSPVGCDNLMTRTQTACNATQLNCGTEYQVRVRETCDSSTANSPFTEAFSTATQGGASCIVKAPSPASISAAATGQNSVDLAWNSVNVDGTACNFSSWLVEGQTSASGIFIPTGCKSLNSMSLTECSVVNLNSATSYEFRLTTICNNSAANSEASSWSSPVITRALQSDPPSNLVVGSATTNTLTVSWEVPNFNDCEFSRWSVQSRKAKSDDELSTPSGCFDLINACNTNCTATNLELLTSYDFFLQVICENSEANSDRISPSTSFTDFSFREGGGIISTTRLTPATTFPITASAPREVRASNPTDSSVKVEWASDKPSRDCKFYAWEVTAISEELGNNYPDGCNDIYKRSQTSCTAIVSCGITYEFVVRELCEFLNADSPESGVSGAITTLTGDTCVTRASQPYNILVLSNGGTFLVIAWLGGFPFSCSNEYPFSAWRLQYMVQGSNTWIDVDCGADEFYTSCHVQNLTPATYYAFRVRQECTISQAHSFYSGVSDFFRTLPMIRTTWTINPLGGNKKILFVKVPIDVVEVYLDSYCTGPLLGNYSSFQPDQLSISITHSSEFFVRCIRVLHRSTTNFALLLQYYDPEYQRLVDYYNFTNLNNGPLAGDAIQKWTEDISYPTCTNPILACLSYKSCVITGLNCTWMHERDRFVVADLTMDCDYLFSGVPGFSQSVSEESIFSGNFFTTNWTSEKITASPGKYKLCGCDSYLGPCSSKLNRYNIEVGSFYVYGAKAKHINYESTRGKLLKISISGYGLMSGDKMMVSYECGIGSGVRGFSDDGMSEPSPDGISYNWKGKVQALPEVYLLCYCSHTHSGDSCTKVSHFNIPLNYEIPGRLDQKVITAALVSVVGPYQDHSYVLWRGYPIEVEGVDGQGLKDGDKTMILTECETGNAITGIPQGARSSGATKGGTFYPFGVLTLDAQVGAYLICWCGNGYNCADISDFSTPLGVLTVVGPDVRLNQQNVGIRGQQLRLEIFGQMLRVGDSVLIRSQSISSNSCYEGGEEGIDVTVGDEGISERATSVKKVSEIIIFSGSLPSYPGMYHICWSSPETAKELKRINAPFEKKSDVYRALAGPLEIRGAQPYQVAVCVQGSLCELDSLKGVGLRNGDKLRAISSTTQCPGINSTISSSFPSSSSSVTGLSWPAGNSGTYIAFQETLGNSQENLLAVPSDLYRLCWCSSVTATSETKKCDSMQEFIADVGFLVVVEVIGCVLGSLSCPFVWPVRLLPSIGFVFLNQLASVVLLPSTLPQNGLSLVLLL